MDCGDEADCILEDVEDILMVVQEVVVGWG